MEPIKKRVRIELGKVVCEPYTSRRECPVRVEVEVKRTVYYDRNPETGKLVARPESECPFEFSVMGGISNRLGTDDYIGGQCREEIEASHLLPKYAVRFKPINRLWKEYHLKKWDDIPEETQKEILEILGKKF